MITKKYYKLIRVSHADSEYFRITNISNEIGEFSIGTYSSGSLEYSLDGVTWTSYDLTNKPSINVNPNANIYLRGTNFKNNQTNSSVFQFTKDYTVGGNFLSLSNYSTMQTVNTIDSNNYILYAFNNQTHLISAQNLNFGNVTSIGQNGLYNYFAGCTNLTTGPDLSNVTSIGQNGLYNCFFGCTNLTTGPDLSNVTSIGQGGINQCFYNCTNLTTAPDLYNVTSIGQDGLSSCFYNCTNLTTAPDLYNVTSIGQYGLNYCFSGCTNLTTGPDLSNVTSIGQYGLKQCFYNCSKLSSATTPNIQDLTANNVLNNWLQNAGSQATGTKVVNVPTGATIATNSNSGIPTGFVRVDY